MSTVDFEKLVESENWEDRLQAARAGYGLERLMKDEFWVVRDAVAQQGFGLEVLVNDPHWSVRAEVAKQGYGLERLVKDKDCFVRKAVAEQGYGWDILRKDNERFIRDLVKNLMREKEKAEKEVLASDGKKQQEPEGLDHLIKNAEAMKVGVPSCEGIKISKGEMDR